MDPEKVSEWNEHIQTAERAQRAGKFDFAEATWMLAVEEAESFGTRDARLAYSLEKLTECLWFQGRLEEALHYGYRALQIYEAALGPSHNDVGSMAYNVAMVYHVLNYFDEAEKNYKRALAIKTGALGAKHPDVIKVLGSFADLLVKLGREQEAAQLRASEKVVTAANWSQTNSGRDVGGRALGYAPSMAAVSGSYPPYRPGAASGSFPPVETAQELMGQPGPVPSNSTQSGAYPQPVLEGAVKPAHTSLIKQIRRASAESPYAQGIVPPPDASSAGSSKVASVSGVGDAGTTSGAASGSGSSDSTSLAGTAGCAAGGTGVAGGAGSGVVSGAVVSGAGDAPTSSASATIASEAASEAAARAAFQRHFDQSAKLVLPVSNHYGNTWEDLKRAAEQGLIEGNLTQAEGAWREAMTFAKGENGENPTYCYVLETLGEVYLRQQNYERAENCLSTAYGIKKKVLGDMHAAVAGTASNLARLFYTIYQFDEAEKYSHESVNIQEKLFGPNSIEAATAMHNLATVYHVQKKYAQAEPFYERAMKIKQLQLGGDHPETVRILKSYANLLRSTHREEQAEMLDQCVTGMISGRWRAVEIKPKDQPEEGWWKQALFGDD